MTKKQEHAANEARYAPQSETVGAPEQVESSALGESERLAKGMGKFPGQGQSFIHPRARLIGIPKAPQC